MVVKPTALKLLFLQNLKNIKTLAQSKGSDFTDSYKTVRTFTARTEWGPAQMAQQVREKSDVVADSHNPSTPG